MKNQALHVLAAVAATMMATAAAEAQTTIDFASYALGTTYDQPLTIGGATFSSSSGLLKIVDLGAGNALCAFDGLGCDQTLVASFSDGASGLTFNFSGDTGPDTGVSWQGETSALSFIGFKPGDGDPATIERQFVRFEDLQYIALTPRNGTTGIGFNSFSYTAAAAAVPEPGTWAMMVLGFAAVGLGSRYRRRRPALAIA